MLSVALERTMDPGHKMATYLEHVQSSFTPIALVGVFLVNLNPLNHFTTRSIDRKLDAFDVIRSSLAATSLVFSRHLGIEGEIDIEQAGPDAPNPPRSGDLGEMSEINTPGATKTRPGNGSPSPWVYRKLRE